MTVLLFSSAVSSSSVEVTVFFLLYSAVSGSFVGMTVLLSSSLPADGLGIFLGMSIWDSSVAEKAPSK